MSHPGNAAADSSRLALLTLVRLPPGANIRDMAVPRTPRPPMVVPKPLELRQDPNEIERWIARLARAIRLRRLEQGFLGSPDVAKPAGGDASP